MNTLFGPRKKKVLLTALAIGLSLIIWHVSYGVGFALGVAVSLINLMRLESYTEELFHYRKFNSFFGTLFFLFGQMVLLIPFVLAFFYPMWVNVIAAAAGALYFKGVIFSSMLSKGAA